jgi:snapalysin
MQLRRWAAALSAVLAVAGVQVTSATPASAAPRILYYDASQAQEFVGVVDQGAQIWNSTVTNVQLQPVTAGRTPNIRVYADDGWPRTYTTSLGNGRWYMGREAVVDGYYEPRIAAHEFGHILGLPDNRTGLCSDLMSGSSAPVACTNANPSAAEAATVESLFRSSAVTAPATYVWQPELAARSRVVDRRRVRAAAIAAPDVDRASVPAPCCVVADTLGATSVGFSSSSGACDHAPRTAARRWREVRWA